MEAPRINQEIKRLKLLSKHNLLYENEKELLFELIMVDSAFEISKLETARQRERKKVLKERFKRWFTYYGVKASEDTAETVFLKLTDQDLDLLVQHTPKYISVTPIEYRKNPYSYLHKKMYKDEVIDRRRKVEDNTTSNMTRTW